MSVNENDVKVLGKVVSIAVDNIVADAEQVFDKNSNLNQETINRNMTNAINQAVADVDSINTRVDSLEGTMDDKLNISDYQTYATQMRESIMLMISEVEEQKQDVLTFDNTPTSGSNNPVTSSGIKSAIDTISSNIKDNLSTYNIKILYDNNGQDEERASLLSYSDSFQITTNNNADFILRAIGGNIETISHGDIVASSMGDISVHSDGEDASIYAESKDGNIIITAAKDVSIQANEATTITGSNDIIVSAGNIEVSASDGSVDISAREEMRINSGSDMTMSSEASMNLSSQENVTLHVPNVHMPRTNDQSIVDIDSYRTNGMYILCGRDVKYKYYDSRSDSLIDGQRSLYGGGILFVQKDGYPSNIILQYLYTGQYLYHRYFEPNTTNYSTVFEKDLIN